MSIALPKPRLWLPTRGILRPDWLGSILTTGGKIATKGGKIRVGEADEDCCCCGCIRQTSSGGNYTYCWSSCTNIIISGHLLTSDADDRSFGGTIHGFTGVASLTNAMEIDSNASNASIDSHYNEIGASLRIWFVQISDIVHGESITVLSFPTYAEVIFKKNSFVTEYRRSESTSNVGDMTGWEYSFLKDENSRVISANVKITVADNGCCKDEQGECQKQGSSNDGHCVAPPP